MNITITYLERLDTLFSSLFRCRSSLKTIFSQNDKTDRMHGVAGHSIFTSVFQGT